MTHNFKADMDNLPSFVGPEMPEDVMRTARASEDSKVNHPAHYNDHPSGVECIEIVQHMNFCLGNAVKYIWRAGLKDPDDPITDLQKAKFYIEQEIRRLSPSDSTKP